ncbi:MAG: hypothetical protein CMG71_01060 [Candidatus Marinimicrobia bacterium]|nr:hypothetical protein [Candidatus Neomarinimicrobiota bacterium]|tara:strand:+ start:83133 stop:83342 length:210 start_codon:yes stop_codon:yes gene_type:complete
MNDILKGNFKVKKKVLDEENKKDVDELEERFEREALSRLGGSIAYVSKRKVLWEEKDKLDVKKKRKKSK